MYEKKLDYEMSHIPEQEIKPFRIVREGNNTLLYEDDHMWMQSRHSDDAHGDLIDKFFGKVLIGGLGLGCIVEKLVKHNNKITKIIVVEKFKQVIDLVWPYLKKDDRCEIVNDDIFNYLKNTTEVFDCATIDTMKGFHPQGYTGTILRAKELIKDKCDLNNVYFWNEDELKRINEELYKEFDEGNIPWIRKEEENITKEEEIKRNEICKKIKLQMLEKEKDNIYTLCLGDLKPYPLLKEEDFKNFEVDINNYPPLIVVDTTIFFGNGIYYYFKENNIKNINVIFAKDFCHKYENALKNSDEVYWDVERWEPEIDFIVRR